MKTILLLMISLLFAQVSKAQDEKTEAPEMPSAAEESAPAKPMNLKFGVQLVSYRYVEPGLIAHSGFLYGVNGEFFYNFNDRVKGIAIGEFVAGKLNYDGALCDVKTDVCSDYSAKTNDVIFRLTHRFDFKVTEEIHLFAGPGIRYLIDKGDEAGFYTRIGTYFFAPLGATIEIPFNFENAIVIDLEYDWFISGTMQSKLSEVNSTYGDITHKQTTGSGHKISVGYQINGLTQNPALISLYYENWNIAASNLERLYVNGAPSTKQFVEPKNFSESLGVKAAVSF